MNQEILDRTIEKLEKIADQAYQLNTRQAIIDMGDVISDISEISTWIVDQDLQQHLINDALTPALVAMEENDGTLLADIITYELLDIFKLLQSLEEE